MAMQVEKVPIENNASLADTFTLPMALDGVPITSVDLAIQEAGEARPLAAWTPYPGPTTPIVRGEYYVFARTQAAPVRAICLGKLIMF